MRNLGVLLFLAAMAISVPAKADERMLNITGFDFNGSDYANFNVNTKSECVKKCANDNNCKAYTFNISTNLCWLKSNIPPHLVQADGAFTGVKYKLPTNLFSFKYFVDFNGSDFGSYSGVSDYIVCMQICDKDSDCRAFTYNVNNQRCYLKSSMGNQSSDKEAISGFKK